METINNIFILSYVMCNCFLAGQNFEKNYHWKKTVVEKVGFLLYTWFLCLLAIPWYCLVIIYYILGILWLEIDGIFQLKFFFNFYLTKEWDNVDQQQLSNINRISENKDSKMLHGRVYKYGTKLINKRFNYKP